MVRTRKLSSTASSLRRQKFIYFALFVVTVITLSLFLLFKGNNNSERNSSNDKKMLNFIQNIDLKGDLKAQLVGAYIYTPGDSAADSSRFVKMEILPPKHRIIKPGYMVTMDYDPERLNVYINDDNYIRDAKFG